MKNLTHVAVSGGGSLIYCSSADGGFYRLNVTAYNTPSTSTVWNYYRGPRWLVDDIVIQLTPVVRKHVEADGSILITTTRGLTYLDVRLWSLEDKEIATHSYQYPRHDRLGLTAEAGLAGFGNLNQWNHNVQDSDSIWTSQQIVAAALRYAYYAQEYNNGNGKNKINTGTLESYRLEAWHGFEGMELSVDSSRWNQNLEHYDSID
jgi:hypothetical protein